VLPVSRFLTIPPEQRAFHLDYIPGADIVPGFIITHSTVPASSLVDSLGFMYNADPRAFYRIATCAPIERLDRPRRSHRHHV